MTRLARVCNVIAAVALALPRAVAALAPAFKGDRPDITPAMVLACVKFACVQLVALELMKPGTQTYILQITGTVVPLVLVLADLGNRSARNKAELAKVILPD